MAPVIRKTTVAPKGASLTQKAKKLLLSTERIDENVEDEGADAAADAEEDRDVVMLDPASLVASEPVASTSSAMVIDGGLAFPAAKDPGVKTTAEIRRVPIPPHRMTPLKRDWSKLYTPLVEECGLQVRMNIKKRAVEVKTSKHTKSPANTMLQKAHDFIAAYGLGFAAEDALALLRMDELYVETFEIKDVKTLHGDHLSRAIGRIAGKEGRTRFTIENASRTRIILADTKIHILGSFGAIKMARDAVCALILGSPPGKVYGNLRTVAARQRVRF